VRWFLGTTPGEAPRELPDVQALRDALLRYDLADPRDYSALNLSVGAKFAPGRREVFFECTETALQRFAVLDAVVAFESELHDRYEKRVWLLPHPGASEASVRSGQDAAAG
jgi:hypothetical protein